MKKSHGPRLISRDFWNGWYVLTNVDTGGVMRGMTHRVRGGLLRNNVVVNFRSARIIGSSADMPDLDAGVLFGIDYQIKVKNELAEISWQDRRNRPPRGQPRWALLLDLPTPCPPWSHPPIKLCGCPTNNT